MPDRRDWMMKDHARRRKTHHGADPFPHIRPIAMHLAIGAEGFGLHERAPVTALPGVFRKRGALGA